MNTSYETIIVGGGVIGNSIAFHLSERDQEGILVIDKNFPLSGTSGSTQAWVWVHNKTPASYAEFSMYSAELYPYLSRKIGDVEYKRTGGLSPFFTEKDLEKAHKLAQKYSELGIKIKVLNKEEVLAKEPSLSPDVVGATFSKVDGNINPFRLVDLLIRASKKQGVAYSYYNRVLDIERTENAFIVHTQKETYLCKKLILAGGAWSKELGSYLGIHVPVKQVRGQIMVTEPLAPLLNYTISGMRQAINGEVLIGYSMEEVGFDRRGTLDVIQETANMAIRYVPSLANANVVRCFSGIRAMPKDGYPIIGHVPGVQNLYVAAMHSGITLAPLIGTLMTELILDGETSIPIDDYSITRFQEPVGQL
ncbi:NAD(P)/FAD-dependent oxidoreductase [Pseudalkalibacillus decolorationis]|uniref:NAD(P)/FAD-dependent oxidoreductase n=1 Tax=Pseudalkalibacillus decolorationis TaxID=163879 RepID=UPI0021492D3E|nr:FAD-binding oxidoreductase [Pseudalkalibacillus decolorationis]